MHACVNARVCVCVQYNSTPYLVTQLSWGVLLVTLFLVSSCLSQLFKCAFTEPGILPRNPGGVHNEHFEASGHPLLVFKPDIQGNVVPPAPLRYGEHSRLPPANELDERSSAGASPSSALNHPQQAPHHKYLTEVRASGSAVLVVRGCVPFLFLCVVILVCVCVCVRIGVCLHVRMRVCTCTCVHVFVCARYLSTQV
jgi:hypothetical protein